ncbi:hypothetical protein GCM10023321_70190 [Pseudonocardia eucalypti]|uniref:Uncharacterized protein n=1 Tax=Pseudonocardia eucalypti TaxID=648755 RepID=A0ABP9R444_9PSEU
MPSTPDEPEPEPPGLFGELTTDSWPWPSGWVDLLGPLARTLVFERPTVGPLPPDPALV